MRKGLLLTELGELVLRQTESSDQDDPRIFKAEVLFVA
jgi:hypothetical protein